MNSGTTENSSASVEVVNATTLSSGSSSKHSGGASSASFSTESVPFKSLNVDDICSMLSSLGLSKYSESFRREGISGVNLVDLTSIEELNEIDIKIPKLYFRNLQNAIDIYKSEGVPIDLLQSWRNSTPSPPKGSDSGKHISSAALECEDLSEGFANTFWSSSNAEVNASS